MAVPIEEVLALWREGERILGQLPDDAVDRRLVEAQVETLRGIYHRLSSQAATSGTAVEMSLRQIDAARASLERAKARLG